MTRERSPSWSLAVLGGSSPGTLALIDALEPGPGRPGVPPPGRLTLVGRDERAVSLVGAYARAHLARLGWQVACSTCPSGGVAGADVVLHQIRYGGAEGRAADEEIARSVGLPSDETLGVAGLSSALRTWRGATRTAEMLRGRCPRAIVVNVTNPLGLSTAALAAEGLNVVGVCELALATALAAASRLGRPLSALRWEYVGLNHRGAVVGPRDRSGRDLLSELLEVLGAEGSLVGVPAAEIARLGAVPTKYHRLLLGVPGELGAPRSAVVAGVRARVLAELAREPGRRPGAMAERPAEWYRLAVVPLLGALHDDLPSRHVVDLLDDDGIVRERPALVSSTGPRPTADAAVTGGPALQQLVSTFEQHERAVLAAARHPGPDTVRAALSLDPTVPEPLVGPATEALVAQIVRG